MWNLPICSFGIIIISYINIGWCWKDETFVFVISPSVIQWRWALSGSCRKHSFVELSFYFWIVVHKQDAIIIIYFWLLVVELCTLMLLYMLFSVDFTSLIIFLMDLLYIFDANVTVYSGIFGHPWQMSDVLDFHVFWWCWLDIAKF